MNLPIRCNVHKILTFLEYLYCNKLSPKVIKNYLSSLTSMAKRYDLEHTVFYDHTVTRYIRIISINSPITPTVRGLFDIKTLYTISLILIFIEPYSLTALFGFLRLSNTAPHRSSKFDPLKHFLRQDLMFAPPGVYLLIKWTKTLQDHKGSHVIQLPTINNHYLCPLKAIKALLS